MFSTHYYSLLTVCTRREARGDECVCIIILCIDVSKTKVHVQLELSLGMRSVLVNVIYMRVMHENMY